MINDIAAKVNNLLEVRNFGITNDCIATQASQEPSIEHRVLNASDSISVATEVRSLLDVSRPDIV